MYYFREYLTDLIESNHIFMKILEHFCKRHRSLVVQKKVKLQKRKKKTKSRNHLIFLFHSNLYVFFFISNFYIKNLFFRIRRTKRIK